MKHIIVTVACLLVSVVMVFYDQLPLPSGGLFKVMKELPWLFEFPIRIGMLLSARGAHGVNQWGFGLGLFLESLALAYGVGFILWSLAQIFTRFSR